MIITELQRKLSEIKEIGLPVFVPREGQIHVVDRTVSTLVGARRAGKSFRACQIAQEYLDQKILNSIDQVCFLDFDNPILSQMKVQDLRLIEDTFFKLNQKLSLKTPLLFIFDEIHKIEGWEEYVVDLSRNAHWKVVVTGSSSKLLKTDIATELRGKAISTTIFPLSLTEFFKFHPCKHEEHTTSGRAERRRLFDQYLIWGSFPAIVNTPEFSKQALLREYFDTMILKDIIQRYNVSKPQHCIQLYQYLLSLVGRPHTLQSATDYLIQNHLSTSRDSVRDYIQWAIDSWLLFTVPVFSSSQREQERNYKKIYCTDWALANHNSSVWDGSYSRALENMVYIQLIRNYPRVAYYLTRTKRQEVDFVAVNSRGKPELLVQVCQSLSDPSTRQREIEPLVATAKYFDTKENVIVTLDEIETIKEQGVTIKVIPAWRWLSEKPSALIP